MTATTEVVVGVDDGSDRSHPARCVGRSPPQRYVTPKLDVVNAYDYMAVVMPLGMGPGIDRDTLEKESRVAARADG